MTALHVLFYQPPCGKWYVHSRKLYPSTEAATDAAARFLPPGIPFAAVPVDTRSLDLIAAGEPGADLPWRCYFCGEVFTDKRAAALHFGADEDCEPACKIKSAEGGLIKALRDTEEALFSATAAMHAESGDVLRTWARVGSNHEAALRAAEETGFERGIRDQARTIENLRRALCWHGDLARMATTREAWQQDVDEAVRFVKDNPEEGLASFPRITAEHHAIPAGAPPEPVSHPSEAWVERYAAWYEGRA